MEIKYILLFGMPRSGTTWLGKVFDSHPETLYRHEPDSFGLLKIDSLIIPVEQVEKYRADIAKFAVDLPILKSARVAGKLPTFPKRYYSAPRYQAYKLFILLSKLGARFGRELTIPNLIDLNRAGQIYLVWKSIESLGRLGVIAQALEHCRAIHIIRHPCGYVASVLRGESQGKFGDDIPSSEDYGLLEMLVDTDLAKERGLTLSAMKEMQPIERLAWRWALFNDKVIRDTEAINSYMYVRYEDICESPIEEYRKLFNFCSLGWDSQVESFIQQTTENDKTPYFSIFKDPKKVANAWKESLTEIEVKTILDAVEGTKSGSLYRSN